jgi:hypothetical protein
VTQKEEKVHVYRILVRKIEGMIPLEELVVNGTTTTTTTTIIIIIIIDLTGKVSLKVV